MAVVTEEDAALPAQLAAASKAFDAGADKIKAALASPDADEFLDKVDGVAALIDGLAKGTISVEAVEAAERAREKEAKAKEVAAAAAYAKAEASKFDNLPEAKKAELKAKVAAPSIPEASSKPVVS